MSHIIDIDALRRYSLTLETKVVKKTVTVAGKPLSANVTLDPLSISEDFTSSGGEGAYDGSGAVSVYTPDQDLNKASSPTFAGLTVEGGISGDATSAQKVDHKLTITTTGSGENGEFDGSEAKTVYTPNQSVNITSSPTFVQVTAGYFVGHLTGEADHVVSLSGGSIGAVPYQSSVGTTTFLSLLSNTLSSIVPTSSGIEWIPDVTTDEVDSIFDAAIAMY